MVNGARQPSLGAGDFRLKCPDTCLAFLDRQGVEVLPCKLGERIARFSRENLVRVHGMER